jgi:hypothetical protein
LKNEIIPVEILRMERFREVAGEVAGRRLEI